MQSFRFSTRRLTFQSLRKHSAIIPGLRLTKGNLLVPHLGRSASIIDFRLDLKAVSRSLKGFDSLWLILGTDNDQDFCAQTTVDTSQYELHHQHYHSVLECEHCPYCEYYYYPQCGPQLIHAFVVNLPVDARQECDHDPECEYMCYPQPGSRALLYALA